MKFKKVTIIGAGFMGGSLSLALKKERKASSVWVLARNTKRAAQIRRLKVFDRVTCDLSYALKGADLVVLACPVAVIVQYIAKIARLLDQKTIVTDMGSTKAVIMRAARKHLKSRFVGSHPLCGSEKKGSTHAQAELFKGAGCIVTPIKKDSSFRVVCKLWRSLGCKVAVLDEGIHDKVLAYISGLPHLVSYALTASLPACFARFAAGSFKDLTRISASDGLLWADIFLSNPKHLDKATKAFEKKLKSLLRTVRRKKRLRLERSLTGINRKHRQLID
jgi:prephenate dehydrogenase